MTDERTPDETDLKAPGDLMRIDRRFGTVVREGPWVVAPRIEVEVSGRLRGGADLVVRRPKRNFDQWTRPDQAT